LVALAVVFIALAVSGMLLSRHYRNVSRPIAGYTDDMQQSYSSPPFVPASLVNAQDVGAGRFSEVLGAASERR
jgi:hypothetical protein